MRFSNDVCCEKGKGSDGERTHSERDIGVGHGIRTNHRENSTRRACESTLEQLRVKLRHAYADTITLVA